ncbi:MAG TPA: DNA-3-methyladenine glycosylase 2 family protein [Thermoleophilia bacterium]|nr:DNA-3-methyladenine glycosylase 2 family protein [Thermoleophilia bacterium]
MARLRREGTVRPVAPFDFDQALDFIATFPPMHGEQVVSEKSLKRAAWASQMPVAFKLFSTGTVEEPELRYEFHSDGPLSEADTAALVRRIEIYLSLDDDLGRFYELIDADPPFATVKRELYGYHQVKFLTPFENACWTILSQRNMLRIAQHMKRVMIREFSAGVEFEGRQYWPFPGARAVVQASVADLTRLLRNSRRAEYIHGAAAAFSEVDDGFLREGPYDEVSRWLTGIPGVGAWSAAFIMIRSLGRMERIPYGDSSLMRIAGHIYGDGRPLPAERLQGLADRYGDLQGYWAHYLRVMGRVVMTP